MAVRCPKCQAENPDTQRFCGDCGTQLITVEGSSVSKTLTLETKAEIFPRGTIFAERYEILEALGTGGMGAVYRVFDRKLEEEIALKLIRPEIAVNRRALERFKNELKVARKITHKSVCKMYDLGESGGMSYITMEYVRGEDLKSLIHRTRALAVGTTVSIARQVAEGLAEAHKLGVTHRDLKPGNIMIDKEGNAKIMDFGIARTLAGTGTTAEGAIIGTPEYMSPEQVEGKAADQRADIYGLGVILFEMLTGHVPFEGDTPLSVAHKHKYEQPAEPKKINPQIPDSLSRLILRCLEKEREKRFQTATEFLTDLAAIEETFPVAEHFLPERKPTISKEITVKFTPKKLFIPGLALVILVTAVMIAGKIFLRKEPAPITSARKSIAVLPFEDLSPNQDHKYLCEGFAETLINALTNVEGLWVPAKTSAFFFEGKTQDIREIGLRLNVENVLEGSAQVVGDSLRVTARISSVRDGQLVWSQIYDRTLEDLFAIQDEIAREIVRALKIRLLSEKGARLVKNYTENLQAYNLYLQGRYFWNQRTKQGMRRSIEFFEKALQKDPAYALAYTGLADCYIAGGGNYLDLPAEVAYPRAIEMATMAIKIDETLAEAHASLAAPLSEYYFDWEGAEKEYKRAIELNPNYATARQWYAGALWSVGRHDEAIAQAKRARELDPLSLVMNTALGAGFYFANRYDEAIEQFTHTLDMNPEFQRCLYWIGMAYIQQARYKEAIASFQEAVRLSEDSPVNLAALGYAYSVSGRRSEAEKILIQLKNLSSRRYISPLDIAMIYVGLEKKEQALEWLERAFKEKADGISLLKVNPIFYSLRNNHRFQDLLRQLNFPEY